MIFTTVGNQLPFDRLVMAVDRWAELAGRADCTAQIGTEGTVPAHQQWVRVVSATDYLERVAEAQVVIAHAGMGTVLSCRDVGVPVIVHPRLVEHGEVRSDHQRATAEALRGLDGVHVLDSLDQLGVTVERVLAERHSGEVPQSNTLPALQEEVASWLDVSFGHALEDPGAGSRREP